MRESVGREARPKEGWYSVFVAESKAASVSVKQGELNGIISKLAHHGYEGMIHSMIRAACSIAGVDASQLDRESVLVGRRYIYDESGRLLVGDVFFHGDSFFILDETKGKLRATEVRHCAATSALDAFCQAVTTTSKVVIDGRRLRGMGLDWLEEKPDFGAFDRMYGPPRKVDPLESIPPDYTEEEADKYVALIDEDNRNLLITLAQARGKALSVDADSEARGKGVPQLLSSGIIRREYLVKCRKDQHLIVGIDDRDQLDAGVGDIFHCATCGRLFREEIVEQIYVLSEFGRKLLSGSRWMMIWITELLRRFGLVAEQIRWSGSAGDDEIDIMTDLQGTKVFFELKDRDFDLGDAYPFAFRVARYGGDWGIIVTTGRVAAEVKSFLKESPREFGNVRFGTIEGGKSIPSQLPDVLTKISEFNIRRLVYPITEYTGFNLAPYVNAWMKRVGEAYKGKHPSLIGRTA